MAPTDRSRRTGAPAGVAEAIAAHFGGDASLYAAFADASVAQFRIDAAQGRAACANGDLAGLRRLGHDLGSALLVLGHGAASAAAAQLDRCAQAGDLPAAIEAWQALEPLLRKIRRNRHD